MDPISQYEIGRLLHEVCRLAGEDSTTALYRALEERRSRLLCKQAPQNGAAELRKLWREERQARRATG